MKKDFDEIAANAIRQWENFVADTITDVDIIRIPDNARAYSHNELQIVIVDAMKQAVKGATKTYGQYDVTYEGGDPIPAISVGDGSVGFTPSGMDSEGFACLVMKCNQDMNVGDIEKLPEGTTLNDLNPDMMLRFDNPKSIDVVIDCLTTMKTTLEK